MDFDRASRADRPRSSRSGSSASSFAHLEAGQPWTPQQIDDVLFERYAITYDRTHLARILRRDGMQYAIPRPLDPPQPADAEEQLFERLHAALEEPATSNQSRRGEPIVLGFFDASWTQPFENSQRVWSYDQTVEIEKLLLTVPWKSIGFYALLGESSITLRERTAKEDICAALEAIREQNPVGRVLLVADNDGGHHAKLTHQRAAELGNEFVFLPPYSPTLNPIEPLWKSLKRKISPEIFHGEEDFRRFVADAFLELSTRVSFSESWIQRFLPDVQKLC